MEGGVLLGSEVVPEAPVVGPQSLTDAEHTRPVHPTVSVL